MADLADGNRRDGRREAGPALGDRLLWAWRWGLRLAPAVALFSLAFVLEGGLRWVALLGLVPLIFAFVPGCPRCAGGPGAEDGFRGPPGH
jgi:hypothetical protein